MQYSHDLSLSKGYHYEPLIGDPCYLYSRLAKTNFFRDEHCAFVFVMVWNELNEIVISKASIERKDIFIDILKEFNTLAIESLVN